MCHQEHLGVNKNVVPRMTIAKIIAGVHKKLMEFLKFFSVPFQKKIKNFINFLCTLSMNLIEIKSSGLYLRAITNMKTFAIVWG